MNAAAKKEFHEHPRKAGTTMSRQVEPSAALLHDRSLKIIAKSLFRELKENGYDNRQIVNLSTELLGLVTSELRDTGQAAVQQ